MMIGFVSNKVVGVAVAQGCIINAVLRIEMKASTLFRSSILCIPPAFFFLNLHVSPNSSLLHVLL